MVLAFIPAGEFQMGSEEGSRDEKPVHTVSLDAFWMDQHEVTYGQFQGFMAAENYEANPCGDGDDYPAACVSWYDAQAYCQWAGRELPTEAQWEVAARGGLVGAKYPWGDEDPVCTAGATNGAQFVNCSGDAAPVKAFSPNGYGLYDMAGNLWEWALDWYDVYPGGDPGASIYFGDTYRVLRGGSWSNSPYYLRVANRSHGNPDFRYDLFGFRCMIAEPGL
jgi:formylglycine-generating enzyme required for sulfatase activity